MSDLTYVRVGIGWNYVCLFVDLYSREIVGHAAGARKDACLVKLAFATLDFPLAIGWSSIRHQGLGVRQHGDRRAAERPWHKASLSKKGCPYDNAVDESTNKILMAEFVYRDSFSTLRELQVKLSDYVHWYNNFRLHSILGYMSPVEFRLAGLTL